MTHSERRYVIVGGALAALLLLTLTTALPILQHPTACAGVETPHLLAKAAYAKDLSTSAVIVAVNADAQLPLASLTKLMTIYVAGSMVSATSTITITPAALAPEGDAGLVVGERWRADDLMSFTLIESANDGAHALALAAAQSAHITIGDFVAQMNATAASLGLSNTYFVNDTGLDQSTISAGAYGSARDMATLVAAVTTRAPDLLAGAAVTTKRFVSLSGTVHIARHTSALAGVIPDEAAVKTGFTDLAGGNIALIVEPIPGHPTAIVILGSTREGRDQDALSLITAARTFEKRAILCNSLESRL